jgi:hypothetical protein
LKEYNTLQLIATTYIPLKKAEQSERTEILDSDSREPDVDFVSIIIIMIIIA